MKGKFLPVKVYLLAAIPGSLGAFSFLFTILLLRYNIPDPLLLVLFALSISVVIFAVSLTLLYFYVSKHPPKLGD
ncbi:hypothetical protein DRO02_00920 [archaeon]|nr:MAG: hypothetical protein DRO02_00920 [archaeon]RLG66189.1 MAG: hypothetical protein DRO21_00055 [archaeon]HDM24147.1 hypothetical protein [Candidatus Bathyarchaeota archaeon]